MGGQWGNDYTVSIFEVPIAALAGVSLTNATLQVHSQGFSTGYFYGSAAIGWLDLTGSGITATGDVVADAMGGPATSVPNQFPIWDSDWGTGDSSGLPTFNVTTYVQADLDAGRTYSTFVMSGSRDTYGSISTAESGSGPSIIATFIPEPASLGLLALGALALLRRR
ncbi:MAG: PEP-CTERM sorting domain-containing protein [Phycisphaerales bacterium]